MNPAFIERRKAERIPMLMRVEYKPFTSKKGPQEAICEDISGNGIRLRVNKPFKQGQYIKSLLYLPNDPTPVHIVDKVVWCKREDAPDSYFEIGAEHISISRGDKDREKFIFFICENLIEYNINKMETTTYGIQK